MPIILNTTAATWCRNRLHYDDIIEGTDEGCRLEVRVVTNGLDLDVHRIRTSLGASVRDHVTLKIVASLGRQIWTQVTASVQYIQLISSQTELRISYRSI